MTDLTTIEMSLVHGGGFVRDAGHAFGFGAGVAVTAGLGLVPSWRTQVPGQPDGFQRRHESIVGPSVTRAASDMSPGVMRDFTEGVGAGATAAPGWSFRHGL